MNLKPSNISAGNIVWNHSPGGTGRAGDRIVIHTRGCDGKPGWDYEGPERQVLVCKPEITLYRCSYAEIAAIGTTGRIHVSDGIDVVDQNVVPWTEGLAVVSS